MKSEAQKRAQKHYLDKGLRFRVDFYPSEQDLIEHLQKQPKKQTYIKELIRKDIEKAKG
jgi:hypothetical protein